MIQCTIIYGKYGLIGQDLVFLETLTEIWCHRLKAPIKGVVERATLCL